MRQEPVRSSLPLGSYTNSRYYLKGKMPYRTDVLLSRSAPEQPFRIGVREGAEHAFGELHSHVDVVHTDTGDWLFEHPETGERFDTTDGLDDEHWVRLIPRFPLAGLADHFFTSVLNGVQSKLVFPLVFRGLSHEEWGLEGDEMGIELQSSEYDVNARVEVPHWWYVRQEEWLVDLAGRLTEEAGLDPLTIEELLARAESHSSA